MNLIFTGVTMSFLRVILLLVAALIVGCSKAPQTQMDEAASKSKEDAQKKAIDRANEMKMKNAPGWRPGQ
jgi:hypothetical protein